MIQLQGKAVDALDYVDFTKDVKRRLDVIDSKIFEVKNHGLTIENYIDRYESIRVQGMITDTLNSLFPLNSSLFRKLEIYDSGRMSELYSNLFPSDNRQED